MQKPSVGRVVHYGLDTAEGVICLAAIVTGVATEGEGEDRIDLDPVGMVVFGPGGQIMPETGWKTYRGEPGEAHRWHWPERVE